MKVRLKKAQGLSLNTIVIAAIVLVVMVVLILIFTGRLGSFNQDYESQTDRGNCPGEIKDGPLCPAKYTPELYHTADVSAGKVCCIPFPSCGELGSIVPDTTDCDVGKDITGRVKDLAPNQRCCAR